MNDKEKSHIYFMFTDVEGNTVTKSTDFPWDASWPILIYEVARTLESAGFRGVVDRLHITNPEHVYDKEAPNIVPLTEEVYDQ